MCCLIHISSSTVIKRSASPEGNRDFAPVSSQTPTVTGTKAFQV